MMLWVIDGLLWDRLQRIYQTSAILKSPKNTNENSTTTTFRMTELVSHWEDDFNDSLSSGEFVLSPRRRKKTKHITLQNAHREDLFLKFEEDEQLSSESKHEKPSQHEAFGPSNNPLLFLKSLSKRRHSIFILVLSVVSGMLMLGHFWTLKWTSTALIEEETLLTKMHVKQRRIQQQHIRVIETEISTIIEETAENSTDRTHQEEEEDHMIMQDVVENTDRSYNDASGDADHGEALQFIHSRREFYEQRGLSDEWKMRGIGYLFSKHSLALKADLPNPMKPGRNIIKIRNVFQQNRTIGSHEVDVESGDFPRDDCDQLTIWVRVNGPEIFAGRAKAVKLASSESKRSSCHWEFPFNLQLEGEYIVDAKVLVWNGRANVGGNDRSQCQYHTGNVTESAAEILKDLLPVHAGFVGYKMHYPTKTCCEVCTRLAPYCQYWASPPIKIPKATFGVNGCELYFPENTPKELVPRSILLQNLTEMYVGGRPDGERPALQYHGKPHQNPTSYFVGCGWDNWFALDFPCLSGDLDDRIYIASPNLTFINTEEEEEEALDSLHQGKLMINFNSEKTPEDAAHPTSTLLPLCTIENEHSSGGRWVRKHWPDADECPAPMEIDGNFSKHKFDIMKHDGNYPHCWHRDDLTRIGNYCQEWNCRLLKPESKWVSALHLEQQWYGVWKPHDCDYMELTDNALQQCITDRKIVSIRTKGNSIARFMNDYLSQRLQNLVMHNGTGQEQGEEGIHVTIDTLKLPALTMSPEDHWFGIHKQLKRLPIAKPNEEHYWMNGFFLSSEREPHVQVARMEKLIEIAEKALGDIDDGGKGYKMINSFDMSAAFAYDAATQYDGLHLIGPPMKMIITKLFHHVCAGTVTNIASSSSLAFVMNQTNT